jgi:hypothetical protein
MYVTDAMFEIEGLNVTLYSLHSDVCVYAVCVCVCVCVYVCVQWYIVLPMVIFTLFGGAEPPPEGAGQGADGKGGGAAAVASAPSK